MSYFFESGRWVLYNNLSVVKTRKYQKVSPLLEGMFGNKANFYAHAPRGVFVRIYSREYSKNEASTRPSNELKATNFICESTLMNLSFGSMRTGKTNFQNTKETRVFFNACERQNNELRTLQAPENSFERDYYFLSSELRQHQLAETRLLMETRRRDERDNYDN